MNFFLMFLFIALMVSVVVMAALVLQTMINCLLIRKHLREFEKTIILFDHPMKEPSERISQSSVYN